MRVWHHLAAGICLLCQGCDKTRDLFGMEEIVAAAAAELLPGGEPDAELEALVLREDGGVRFRRDLEYPSRLTVEHNIEVEFRSVRMVRESAFGRESLTLNHVRDMTLRSEKAPGRFTMKPTEIVLRTPVKLKNGEQGYEDQPTPQDELHEYAFVLTEDGWKLRQERGPVDFGSLLRGGELEPAVPDLMVACGAHPRAQWLSSSRIWQEGDQVVLASRALRMIHPSDITGKMTLTFEGEEPINGHPCGVFQLRGDYDLRDAVDFTGKRIDEAGRVEEGRLWASLLYPVILRTEMSSIVTRDEHASGGGPGKRLQGRVVTTETLAWYPEG